MKRRACVALVLGVLSSVGAADASAPDPCLTAPVDGQALQKQGKLLDARARFVTCAHQVCPREIAAACTRWAHDVEASIPTVVFEARDQQGNELGETRVAIDDLAPQDIGAHAIEIDPGNHRFTFQRSGSSPVVVQGLVRDGEKNRMIRAVFPLNPARPAPVDPAPPPRPAPSRDEPAARPVPTLTWVLGGVATVSLVAGAVFGSLYLTRRVSEHCDVGCGPAQKNSVFVQGVVADISLGVGVVTAGIAAWSYASRPTVARGAAGAAVDIRAVPGGAVATMAGRF
jgi:hypothetical protein